MHQSKLPWSRYNGRIAPGSLCRRSRVASTIKPIIKLFFGVTALSSFLSTAYLYTATQ